MGGRCPVSSLMNVCAEVSEKEHAQRACSAHAPNRKRFILNMSLISWKADIGLHTVCRAIDINEIKQIVATKLFSGKEPRYVLLKRMDRKE
jgi:hypothetical protein